MAGKTKSRAYIQEWMLAAGLKQTDLVTRLGYSKAKANAIWHGEQRANEDILDQVGALVHAKPYELMMAPDRAMYLRNIEAVIRAVPTAEPEPGQPQSETPKTRKGR